MSSAEADELPPHLHAMVEPDPLAMVLAEEVASWCRECGYIDLSPHVEEHERAALDEVRTLRRAGWTDGGGLLAPS